PDTHDRLYKMTIEEEEDEDNWRFMVRAWLKHNSRYFRDELIKSVRTADTADPFPHEDVEALAKLDWETARPFIEKFAVSEKPGVWWPALLLLYEHAIEADDATAAEGCRRRLKEIVARNPSSSQMAIMALMKGDWDGQEEWFISLFTDPFFTGEKEEEPEVIPQATADLTPGATHEVKGGIRDETGPGYSFLTGILAENPDKWVPVFVKFIGHDNRRIHDGAVKCLLEFTESHPGDNKHGREIARALLSWSNHPARTSSEDRMLSIAMLAYLKSPESIPALRRALEEEKRELGREPIVKMLAQMGGFSEDEVVSAIEAYARKATVPGGETDLAESIIGNYFLPLDVSIGRILLANALLPSTEAMAIKLFARVETLNRSQPATAKKLLEIIRDMPYRIAYIKLIERIGDESADVNQLAYALWIRDSLRKSVGQELSALVEKGGYSGGTAALLLGSNSGLEVLLSGTDTKAQIAVLACARYAREKLPIEKVAKLLNT